MKSILSRILSGINYMLFPLGLKLKRLVHPTRDFKAFFAHLSRFNWNFKTIVDVGVAHGTPAIYSSYPKARYFLVEPLEECRPVLERLKRSLNAEYFLFAAGAEDTETIFYVHSDLSGSSRFPQAEGNVLDGVPRQVAIRRLDTILPKTLERPALVKLDTQGAELEALQGLGDLLLQVDMIIIETSFMKFRDGTPEFADVVRALSDRNFVVYDILEGHVRMLDEALAQVDLVFVPRNSSLRSSHQFFSDIQAQHYANRRH